MFMDIDNTTPVCEVPLFDQLRIAWHDAPGYCAIIPTDKVEATLTRFGEDGLFCQLATRAEIPRAEDHAAILLGAINPFKLRAFLQEEKIAKEVAIDTSHWVFSEDGYSDVVDAVFRLPDPNHKTPDYQAMGITTAHVPELIWATCCFWGVETFDEKSPYYWGIAHAFLAMNTFPRVPAGVMRPLIEQLRMLDDEEYDWLSEMAPKILGKVGPEVVPLLATLIRDTAARDEAVWSHTADIAMLALTHVGTNFPEARSRCVQTLVLQLMSHAHQNTTTNGFIISYLRDLKAIEAMDAIEAAFRADRVDTSVLGDLENVRISLGLQHARITPAHRQRHQWLIRDDDENDDAEDGDYEDEEYDVLEPIRRETPKIGRNDPCPCKSGKKYKKCCGKNNAPEV